MENPINMDDLGIPLFLETPICTYRPMVGWSLRIVGGEDSDWLGRPTSRINQEEVFFFEVFHSIYDI